MNLSESLSLLMSKIDQLSTVVTEAKGHMDHPEDLVLLNGGQGAERAIQATVDTGTHPQQITIKWDGYPALIFGRGPNGKFSIMDKHMFNKADGSGRNVYSPEQFAAYDKARGVDRTNLHTLINEIWPGLEKADTGKGYYWGDLLFSQPLQPGKDGLYRFKANPNGITYTVDPKSDNEIVKLLHGKQAGIVVHQFISPTALTTDEAQPLNGTIGKLKNNSNVAIVPAKMPITPKVKIDKTLLSNAKKSAQKYGDVVSQYFENAPQAKSAFTNLFTTYINKRIVAGHLNDLTDGFIQFMQNRPLSGPMQKKLMGYDTLDPKTNKEIHVPGYIDGNVPTLQAIFQLWIDVYNLKMNVVEQLNRAAQTSPIQGYLDDGTNTQEGFVSHGLKFVDRMGFSRQNLAGR